jgi:hypothetical protein
VYAYKFVVQVLKHLVSWEMSDVWEWPQYSWLKWWCEENQIKPSVTEGILFRNWRLLTLSGRPCLEKSQQPGRQGDFKSPQSHWASCFAWKFGARKAYSHPSVHILVSLSHLFSVDVLLDSSLGHSPSLSELSSSLETIWSYSLKISRTDTSSSTHARLYLRFLKGRGEILPPHEAIMKALMCTYLEM